MSTPSFSRSIIRSSPRPSSSKFRSKRHSSSTTALPNGQLSPSAMRNLIALHHLSRPSRQITLPPPNSSATTKNSLPNIIKHTFTSSQMRYAEDRDLRQLAEERINARGPSARHGDQLVTLPEEEGASRPLRKQTAGERNNTSNEPEYTLLYFENGRTPTVSEEISTSSLPWSSSSSSSSRINNLSTYTTGKSSLAAERQLRFEEALYGVSRGSEVLNRSEMSGGRGKLRSASLPGLDALLEWVEKEKGIGGGQGQVEKEEGA